MAWTNLLGQVRVGVRGLPYVGLFSTYTGSNAAYSLRKLSSSYNGSAIRVRRSGDNIEQEIGFDITGNLDTTSLLSFIGANNTALYSEEFENVWWHKNDSTAVANQTTDPNGTMTADLYMEGTSNWNHSLGKSTLVSFVNGTSWNSSVYLKKGPGATAPDTIALGFGEANGAAGLALPYAIFNISTGVVVTSGNATGDSNFGSSITDAGNGWWRCSMWGTVTSTMNRTQIAYVRFVNNQTTLPGQYLGKNTSNIYVWGYQWVSALNDTSVLTTAEYRKTSASTGGIGYVTKWYDQSGSSRDATQITSSYQPYIVSGGSLILRSGKPAIYFDGVDDTLRLSTILPISDITTLFTVAFANYENSSNDIVFGRRNAVSYRFGGGNSLINSLCITRAESADYIYAATPASTTGLNTLAVFHNHYSSGNYDGLNRTRIYSNGVWRNDGNSFGQSGFSNIEYIGSGGDCQFFKNTIQELIHYPSNQISNRILIENNINSYYSLWNRTGVVSDGLVLNLDASDINSYLTTGTEWYNIAATSSIIKGTLVASPVFGTAGILTLNGSTQYISISGLSSALNNVSKFTYETWIRVTNPSSASTQTIFSFGNQQNNNHLYDIMFFFVSNQICLQVNNGVDGGPVVTFTSTNWNSISVVYDGTKTGNSNRLKLYINGVLQTLDFGTYNVPSTTSNLGFTNSGIGGYSSGGFNNKLTGSIGSSRLYTKSLTDEEVLQNFNATKSRFGL